MAQKRNLPSKIKDALSGYATHYCIESGCIDLREILRSLSPDERRSHHARKSRFMSEIEGRIHRRRRRRENMERTLSVTGRSAGCRGGGWQRVTVNIRPLSVTRAVRKRARRRTGARHLQFCAKRVTSSPRVPQRARPRPAACGIIKETASGEKRAETSPRSRCARRGFISRSKISFSRYRGSGNWFPRHNSAKHWGKQKKKKKEITVIKYYLARLF